jgi:hypothetical protein
MLNLRTDWTAEELMVLAKDADTRIERVEGTLLIKMTGHLVQFALVPQGLDANFGDAEFILRIYDSPASSVLPLPPGEHRLVCVGRAPKPNQPFYEFDGAQKLYRLDEYAMLWLGGSRGEEIGDIWDTRRNKQPVSVTEEWRWYLVGTRGRILAADGAVLTITPYNEKFVREAKSMGGRWYWPLKAWVFAPEKADSVRDLVEAIYGES